MSERARGWLMGVLIVTLVAVAVAVLVAGRGRGDDRAAQLEQRLRCPACKSVSIAESPSSTASSMRRIVESQVAQGRSDEQIIGYFTARYGQWVVTDAPPRGDTLPLWLLVLAAAGAGGAVLLSRTVRRRSVPDLAASDRAEVGAALADYVSRDPEGNDGEP